MFSWHAAGWPGWYVHPFAWTCQRPHAMPGEQLPVKASLPVIGDFAWSPLPVQGLKPVFNPKPWHLLEISKIVR
jgi:hypothetical protein